jgi:hypothetical protein
MEIKSKFYQAHIASKMYDVPKEQLQELIDEFSVNAKFFMSSDEDSATTAKITKAVVEELKDRFKYLPLSLVAEAFSKGAKGELGGTTRFTFRNVYTWLKAIEEKNQKLYADEISRKEDRQRAEQEKQFRSSQRRSTLYGSAFYRKLEWCYEGLVSSSDYDRLTLDRIVAMIEQGHDIKTLTPKMILR